MYQHKRATVVSSLLPSSDTIRNYENDDLGGQENDLFLNIFSDGEKLYARLFDAKWMI